MGTTFGGPQMYPGGAGDERTKELLQRALTSAGRFFRQPMGEGMMPPMRPGPPPSRDAVRGMASSHDPKDRDKALREKYAASQAERDRRGEDPRNIRSQDPEVPRDPKRDPVGTGTELAELKPLSSRTPFSRYSPTETMGRAGAATARITLPDGREVTRGPRENMEEVSGRAGTMYLGQEMALPSADETAGINLPTDEDRSAGWATRAAINELYRKGELSMDPGDVADRRRWEEQETARDMARERAEAEHARAMAPPIDPYQMAMIEAQGRYGGQALSQEAKSEQIMAALTYYAQLSQQLNAIEAQLASVEQGTAQHAALTQARDRLIQERREMPNLALGFKLQDPKLDPLAALAGLVGVGAPQTEGGQ